MFKERIKKVGLSIMYFIFMFISIIAFLFSLNWLITTYPSQSNVVMDIATYILGGFVLLICLIGFIFGICKLVNWLIIEPYQEYKVKKIKE